MTLDAPGPVYAWRDELLQANSMKPIRNVQVPSNEYHHVLSADGPVIAVTDLAPSQPFDQVVQRRRSIRQVSTPRLDDLGLVVARVGMTRHGRTTDRGQPVISRPHPSAGARHPLRLVIVTERPLHDVHPHRGWVLDPDAAVLRPAALSESAIDEALAQFAAALSLPTSAHAAITVVGFPAATLDRYPGGMSLLWREVGALLMLVHLAATDIRLGSCLVGTCGALYPIGPTPQHPVDLGAVVIGTTDAVS